MGLKTGFLLLAVVVAVNCRSLRQLPSTNFFGDGTTDLSLSLLQAQAQNTTNYVFSPLGYSTILAILAEGSRGNTRNQLVSALKLPEDTYAVRNTYKNILSSLQEHNVVNKPEFKNWFYVYKNYTVEKTYKEVLLENYLTEVKEIDRDYETVIDGDKEPADIDFEKKKGTQMAEKVEKPAEAKPEKMPEPSKAVPVKEAVPVAEPTAQTQTVPQKMEEVKPTVEEVKPTVAEVKPLVEGNSQEEMKPQSDEVEMSSVEEVKPVMAEVVPTKTEEAPVKTEDKLTATQEKFTKIPETPVKVEEAPMAEEPSKPAEKPVEFQKPTIVAPEFVKPSPIFVPQSEQKPVEPVKEIIQEVTPVPVIPPKGSPFPEKEVLPVIAPEKVPVPENQDLNALEQMIASARAMGASDSEMLTALSANRLSEVVKSESTPESKMIIFNGLYFRGNWSIPFAPKVDEEPFYISENEKKDVPMMHAEGEYETARIDELDATALELPYQGERYSLLVLLPNSRNGLHKLITNLDSYPLSKVDKVLEKRRVEVCFPTFKFFTISRPKEALTKLGVTDIFTESADLSGISGQKGLFLDDLVQLVTLEVDHGDGTANFLTSSSVAERSTVHRVSVDRPFLFFLRDRVANMVVVAGKLHDPTSSQK